MAATPRGLVANIRQWLWRGIKWLILSVILLSVSMVLLVTFVNPPVWAWRVERAWFPPKPNVLVRHDWLPLAQISPDMQLAVIASEDQRFPFHHGVDPEAIGAALEDREAGEKLRGASTLTQQTVKNLFLWPSRSFVRKGIEAWLALLLDTIAGKRRTLELYLNIVEFGPGIYGVGAAAQYYFHKPASQLTAREAALLAAILPNPWEYRINPPSAYMNERADWIERQMRQLGMGTLKLLQ
ncbi:monofunctional biosynthetic peptidoglycan transglycosylase [Shewanella sp. GXUN23E]|uniref:monofunctional biosynthetic peptidoglycan transglycosylase n=1 Tax=Shewanella sp. GXUN23E TaxID=3422498 RepID=UPI003D7E85B0